MRPVIDQWYCHVSSPMTTSQRWDSRNRTPWPLAVEQHSCCPRHSLMGVCHCLLSVAATNVFGNVTNYQQPTSLFVEGEQTRLEFQNSSKNPNTLLCSCGSAVLSSLVLFYNYACPHNLVAYSLSIIIYSPIVSHTDTCWC